MRAQGDAVRSRRRSSRPRNQEPMTARRASDDRHGTGPTIGRPCAETDQTIAAFVQRPVFRAVHTDRRTRHGSVRRGVTAKKRCSPSPPSWSPCVSRGEVYRFRTPTMSATNNRACATASFPAPTSSSNRARARADDPRACRAIRHPGHDGQTHNRRHVLTSASRPGPPTRVQASPPGYLKVHTIVSPRRGTAM